MNTEKNNAAAFGELLPCPFCGNKSPFQYITYACVVLRCKCGVEVANGAAKVMYDRGQVPRELAEHTYEAKLLTLHKDGKELGYPEHGQIGVNAIAALWHSGAAQVWNRRASNG